MEESRTGQKVARVLIVDDSIVFRKALELAFSGIPFVKIIGSAYNGLKALEFIENQECPDIVTLDVEMPELDGIETLIRIQEYNRNHPDKKNIEVIMVSSLTMEGAQTTIRALQNGAFDFITKPNDLEAEEARYELKRKLKEKIFSLLYKEDLPAQVGAIREIRTRTVDRSPYDVILIGVSTGGPRALATLLPELTSRVDLPIVIVQHMPPGFTKSLADNLDKKTGTVRVVEAEEGEFLQRGKVYVAKGGAHQVIRENEQGIYLATNDSPPENGSRPSVDVLFRSAAGVVKSSAIALILTGMGTDGVMGLKALKRAGSYVIAQDKKSSVVWGMPGSAVRSQVVDEVLSLQEMPERILALTGAGN